MITYFIQSGEYVKIGVTGDIQSRINSLRHASPNPPVLLKVCCLPESDAHKIAGMLTERAQGEWFGINDDLINWINSLQTSEEGYMPTERTPGRPATGKTKMKMSLTINKELIERVKNGADSERMSLSAYVERAIATYFDGQREAEP
jgi:predicted HicB family RNase H-like nuclease